MKLFDLTGDVAVVIGATGVLGGALAEGLAEAGAKIAVIGRNAERGEARVKSIQAKGGIAAFFAADAVSRCSLGEAHEKIEATLGAPTILLNAAGGNDPKVTVTADHPFESIQLADWQANFDMNLAGGVLLPCQEFGPDMCRRGKGSIINIASASAHLPASSAMLSAICGLDGTLIEIGRLFFEAKNRMRPVGSTASTAPQRGHLNLPTAGTSRVTRQRAHGACMGKAAAVVAAAGA